MKNPTSADRDLVLGVLAAQAGFVTPAQVVAAASARILVRDGRSLLDHLVESGALTPARRDLVAALADEVLAANGGSPERVLDSVDGARVLSRTLGMTAAPAGAEGAGPPLAADRVPVEREGQYVRLDELGRGGQSIVWRALDRFVGREVAIKELTSPGADGSPQSAAAVRARFLREARLTAQLDHPGIVAVHELAERPDGTLYCAQKLVRGRTLKAELAQCRTLRRRLQLLPHLVDAAQAVSYAHARAVVHRDLKPSNVMVGAYGETVVVDWGLAKRRGEPEPAAAPSGSPDLGPELTQAGLALGTPAYMSPEQARGDLEAIDERSDVFSLGAMLYELLTGAPPFEGADNAQLIEAALAGRFVPVRLRCPEAPPELAAIAERALRTDPAGRYPDAAAVASDLLAFRAGRRVNAYSYGALELVRKFVARNPALTAAIWVAVAILIAAAGVVLLQLRQARIQLARAFIERARHAEDASDWARAAAFYAASRLEHDTAAARWGVALARERVAERRVVARGGPGDLADVDVLPDGTLVALEQRGKAARLYEVATGRTLWKSELEGPITVAQISDGAVRLRSGVRTHVLDEQTGNERFTSDGNLEALCTNGPPSRRARIDRPGLFQVAAGGGHPVEVDLRTPCATSRAGDRLALRDQSGLVRLWDLESGRELAARPAADAQGVVFTAHGVAVVRSASLQLFGGEEGDFSVEVPGRSASSFAFSYEGRPVAVSPDGHRVVVDSPTLNRADVVDLRDRTVFVSVSRPPGEPSYAFSADGGTLYAAGIGGARTLVSWNLRRPAASASGSGRSRLYLRAALGRFALFEYRKGFEVRSEAGALLAEVADPEAQDATLSADGSTLALSDPHEIRVLRADDRAEIARVACELCRVILLSRDGSRLLGLSVERRRVWDVGGRALLRDEPNERARMSIGLTFSPRGDRFGWFEDDRVVLEDVGTGARVALALPEPASWASFSPDGERLAVVGPGRFGVYQIPGLDPEWTVPNPSSVGAVVGWSSDGSILTIAHEGAGAALLDARTGETLARIVEGRSGGQAAQVNVLPGLGYRLSRGARSWFLTPLPPPDASSPAEGLRRALLEGSFRLHGGELEDVLP